MTVTACAMSRRPAPMITVAREPYRLLPETAAESIGVNGPDARAETASCHSFFRRAPGSPDRPAPHCWRLSHSPMIPVPRRRDRRSRSLLALIRSELDQPRCGHAALLSRVGEILLITLLRHIIARPGLGSGLLSTGRPADRTRPRRLARATGAAPGHRPAKRRNRREPHSPKIFRARWASRPATISGDCGWASRSRQCLPAVASARCRAAGYASPSAIASPVTKPIGGRAKVNGRRRPVSAMVPGERAEEGAARGNGFVCLRRRYGGDRSRLGD